MINVSLLGVGLMGGSLGKALRRVRKKGKRVYSVQGWGRSQKKLEEAKRRGAVDSFSANVSRVVSEADIVVLATPLTSMVSIVKKITPHLKSYALLTDVGSVKTQLQLKISQVLKSRRDVTFVGSHPLAGSEKSGVEFSSADLFKGATCVVTGSKKGDSSASPIIKMWRDVGAKPVFLSSSHHDRVVAFTSHLPHLMSFALFSLVEKESRRDSVIKSLVAGSFRDMTRIAASDPAVWAGIFEMNKKELTSVSKKYLSSFQKILSTKNPFSQLTFLSRKKKKWGM